MKKYHVILGLLLVLLVVGCTTQEQPVEEVNTEETVAETAEQPVETTETTAEVTTSGSTEVSLYGQEGFDPMELKVSVGTTVYFVNRAAENIEAADIDEDTKGKSLVLTFQKDGSRVMFNSQLIKFGDTYSHTFDEAGNYEYWTQGYGTKGLIVVE
jgi:plastocyanin